MVCQINYDLRSCGITTLGLPNLGFDTHSCSAYGLYTIKTINIYFQQNITILFNP